MEPSDTGTGQDNVDSLLRAARGGGRGALNRLCLLGRSPGVNVLQVDPTVVLDRLVGTGISVPSGLSTVDFPAHGWGQVEVSDAPVDRDWFLPSLGSTAS